ncbi:MAG: DUF4347 domain-containing protein [Nitrospira sp.]
MFGFGKKKNPPDSSGKKARQISVPSAGIKGSLVSLEQRLMFDAAASATASEVATEQVAQEQAEAAVSSDHHAEGPSAEQAESQGLLDAIAAYNPGESRSEVVFVDPTVPNYQDLLSGMNSNVEVIMLDGGQDGIEQMANALSGRTGIDAIHVISHGGAGELQLGTGVLNAESMSRDYADDLAVIQQSLSEQADILVYGCEFAQGEAGQAAVDMLAELTGADVQASTDLTGNISLGGDWEFEISTGTIETSLAMSYDTQMNWAGVLGTETVADNFSSKSYGNNDGTQSWSSKWSEVDVGASDADGGHIKVNSGELRIETQKVGASVSRGVDLSGVSSATLSFDYENDLDKGGSVDIRISTDGGKSYTTLGGGTFSSSDNTGSGTVKFDISRYASADTKIQFVVTGTSGGDRLFVDNVQVSYDTGTVNQAPMDLTLTGDTVAENAATGTVVGTAAGVDPDAGDTKSYSLTDTAGGRFAINASTGQITVADGSLLNYEANASHTITVQVTDSGGLTVDKTFTIGVSDVKEVQTENGDGKSHTQKGDVKGQTDSVIDPVVVPVAEQVSPEPMVVAVDPVVEPVSQEPVVEAAAEPTVEVAVDPVPVVESASPDPVVNVAVEPESVVEPVTQEPMVDVAAESAVETTAEPEPDSDPIVIKPIVEMAAGPSPVMDPVVAMTADAGPIVKPVVTEQSGGSPNVNIVDTKASTPGVEQTLVASLHQQASTGVDMSHPLASSQNPLSDLGGGKVDAAKTAEKPVDVQPELAGTMESKASSQISSPIGQKGVGEQTTASGKGETLSSSASSKDGAAVALDSGGAQDPARFAFGQIPWPPAEGVEMVPENSEDLAMPMLAGLVGAALQGNLKKKEKLTAMHGDTPTSDEKSADEQTSQEPRVDEKESPPRAA